MLLNAAGYHALRAGTVAEGALARFFFDKEMPSILESMDDPRDQMAIKFGIDFAQEEISEESFLAHIMSNIESIV